MSEAVVAPPAPVSLKVPLPRVKTETAILMQGGAMRGAFGAGVLYELATRGIFLDTVAAASASVPTAAYYVAGQYEDMRTIWLQEVGNSRFIRYDNLLLGRPIYDIDYLIHDVFQKKYPLSVESLSTSRSRLVVPLYNYISQRVELRTSKDEGFSSSVWSLIHVAMTVHGRHILWGTPYEQYVDGAIDPFALYKADFLPEGTRVLSVWNEAKFDMHVVKSLGQKLFLLLQSRNFPDEIKQILRARPHLIEGGMHTYQDFCTRMRPVVIKPDAFSLIDGIDVLSRSNEHLAQLFEHGRAKTRTAYEAGTLQDFV